MGSSLAKETELSLSIHLIVEEGVEKEGVKGKRRRKGRRRRKWRRGNGKR